MEGLHFEITADNSNFTRKLQEVENGVRKTSRQIEQSGMSIEELFGRMTRAAAAFGAGLSAKELVSNIVRVRGEFQQLEVAFKTMLGSAEKADALMSQLVKTAAITPFDLQGVANGAKQLLAYGLASDKVNETLIRLGDIAAGLSIPLNDIVYLYGTTMTQGRLFTQDLRQFMGRGIPLADELAKQFGVTKDKVGELVTAGKVGFPEVQKAIEAMTNEGGQFGGLMEAQSKTITGQISNIEDAISTMFNELGQQSEGVINKTLSGVSSLVENYERVGRVVVGLVGTYGAYKAAVMTVTAMQALQAAGLGALTAAEAVHYGWLVLVEKAQKLLNATMLNNPYVLVATLIAGVVATMISMKSETERLKEADERYEEQKRKTIDAEEEHLRKMKELCDIAGDEAVSTDTRRAALHKLIEKYPDIFAKYKTEIDMLKDIKHWKDEIAKIEGQRSITDPKNELADVEKRIKELEGKKKYVTEYYQDSYKRWQARTVVKSARTRDEEAELQALKNRRGELKKTIRKNEVDAYFQNLTGVSNEEIENQLKVREDLLARIKLREQNGEKNVMGKITSGPTAGTYTQDELKAQLKFLETEKNQREAEKKSNAEWAAAKKKTYEEALKAFNDYVSSKKGEVTEEEFDKGLKKKKDALDLAKKEYDKVKAETDKEAEKSKKEADARLKAQEKLNEELLTLERQNQQDEINLKEEGLQKKLKQIDLDYKQQKKAIDKQVEDWKQRNKEAGITDVNANGLTTEQQGEIDEAAQNAAKMKAKAEKDWLEAEAQAMRDYLAEYGTYQQQKLAIAEEYAKKISKAQTEGEKLALGKELQERLSSINLSEFKRKFNWDAIFGDLSLYSANKLKELRRQIKDFLQKDTSLSAIDKTALIEQYNKLGDAIIRDEEALSGLFSFKSGQQEQIRLLEEEYELRKQIYESLVNQQKIARVRHTANETDLKNFLSSKGLSTDTSNINVADILSKLGGSDKMSFQNLFQAFNKSGTELSNLTSMVGEAGSSMNTAAAAFQGAGSSMGGTIAIIDAIVHGINDMVQGIAGAVDLMKEAADSLGTDTSEGTKWGQWSAFANTFAQASQHATDAWDSLKNGNGGGVIKGVVGSFTSWITGIAGMKDARHEKKIKNLQERVEDLTKAYDKLERSIDKAYSKDATRLIEQNNQNLERQQQLIRQQMQEEEAKKNTDKERIKEWQDELERIDEQIEDNKERAEAAIFGEDLQSAIENFAEAYADAWASGEDRVQSAKDTVKSMMRQMVIESIKAAMQSSEAMKRIREQLKLFYADNVLTDWEQDYIYNMAEELQKELDDQFGWADKLLSDDESSERTATAKGIAQASQDSVDELNGRFTVIQGHTYSISENMVKLTELQQTHLPLLQNLSHLAPIQENTYYCRRLDGMDADLRAIKNTLENIETRGIQIKA